MAELDPVTSRQLDELDLSSSLPLLICDVDEVVLHLVSPFERVLNERGFELRSHSFKLTGNVFHRETGSEATQDDIWSALELLFTEQRERQHVVDGAVAALNDLADAVDTIFLTNLPHDFADIRREYLRDAGLSQPLVSNTGSKAPAIARLKAGRPASAFIDDTPVNLHQTRAAHPDVALFHFMADETFRALAGSIEGVVMSSGDWTETAEAIRRTLT